MPLVGDRRLRPGVRRGLVAAGAIAIAGGGAYASTYTALFEADAVHVEGEIRIDPAELRRLAEVEVGVNVFHLDTGAAEARLARDPRIADASVEADLPDAVTLRIVERVPVGRAEVAGSSVIVADDGAILPGHARAALPEIRSVAGELDPDRRTDLAAILASLAPAIRRNVATVFSEPSGEVLFETRGGVTVTYGRPEELRAKAAALRAVLEWASAEGIVLVAIDVTVPTAPTARTADGTVTPT